MKLAPHDALWRSIGIGLRVSDNELVKLDRSCNPDQYKLDHVLQTWIEMDGQATPVTWKTILEVLRGPLVNNMALHNEIYQYLKQESTKQQNVTSKCIQHQ